MTKQIYLTIKIKKVKRGISKQNKNTQKAKYKIQIPIMVTGDIDNYDDPEWVPEIELELELILEEELLFELTTLVLPLYWTL